MKKRLLKSFGETIDENFTAEDFSGNLGELLADPVADRMPDHIRQFVQTVYELACSVVMK